MGEFYPPEPDMPARFPLERSSFSAPEGARIKEISGDLLTPEIVNAGGGPAAGDIGDQPVSTRDAMLDDVASARGATKHLDESNDADMIRRTGRAYTNFGPQEGELMEVGSSVYGPRIETNGQGRVDGRLVSKSGVEYHVYDKDKPDVNNPNGKTTVGKVTLADGREREITNPETVQKLIGKIATQVERRAAEASGVVERRAS